MKTRIDLFKLHDYKEDLTLKKSIMGKGTNLKKELSKLMNNFDKTKLVKQLLKEFNISIASAERLVYLKKDWFPLFFIEYLIKINNKSNLKYEIQDRIELLKANQPPERIYKAVKFLSPNLCKIAGAHTADGTLTRENLKILLKNGKLN